LKRLLVAQPRTLIVAAYGGWDDVFTEALVEIMEDEQAKLDIIWCFYENDPTEVEQRYGALLRAMEPAIRSNRFRPFGGIDCHTIFSEILATLQGTSPADVTSITASPIAGWQLIDPPYLDSLPALNSDQLIRYFDGAVPTWLHAISAAIPRRLGVEKLTTRLAQVAHDNVARSMHLVRAAGGEGKSTLLLQAAADVARTGDWSVLWRTSPKEGISPEQVANLDKTRRWLIVADDADGIVLGLAETAEHNSQSGRDGVHFLLAARDADWKNAGGPRRLWSQWLDTDYPDIVLRGITPDDAGAVLTAWENAGSEGLRELAAIADSVQRATAFESAVRDAVSMQEKQMKRYQPQEGSFFGGLLAVRFGQNGLQAHVRAFLQRLEHMHIEPGNSSLFDALLYIAACHGTGIPGIDERVLADLVSVPREWVRRYVVRPLGEEAAAVYSAGYALTRHSQVAAAILVEAEETFQMDLAEIWDQLVRQTVRTGYDTRMDRKWFSSIVHAGPSLQKALPKQIPLERRKTIAIAAAKACVDAEPTRLTQVVDLGRTYRQAADLDQAAHVFRSNLASAPNKVDHSEVIRSYWYEWGVCEGLSGDTAEHRAIGAWLQGFSLSDHLSPAPITDKQAKLSCAGVGVAFSKLLQPESGCPFAKALRAVAYLGRLTSPDHKATSYFDRHDRDADKLNTPRLKSVTEAIAWLTAGVAQARRDLHDPFLQSLAEPDHVSFKLLRDHLAPKQDRRASKTRPIKRRKASTTSQSDASVQFSSPVDGKVQTGIERVISEAWAAVPLYTATEDRFKIARRQAMQSISRLSPYIKRQVRAHFETSKWALLRSGDPNA